ncbi:hypothetical protein N7539_004099 [Penicillium diatomitis]|uniref:Late sexual development protein n=1 Tax=Penicillium diatomitis TaxID=2819901 RepID=A0A9X0BY67_9EURO|nr:uncharacterized protein N7539_004099 [Penicillium diatomitis]KAJ5489209.1 hypothetical protein N7539_004099 [Penicillium diatomitis]
MHFSDLAILSSILALPVLGVPHPQAQSHLPDGLPSPDTTQVAHIEQVAQGTLPNSPAPTAISNEGIVNLKLIAFNELFEVAFFSELVNNVTNNVDGYTFKRDEDRSSMLEALKAIVAQEELHALRANDALKHFKATQVQPCKYKFPVQNLESAIKLAATFTDVVLGTLQDVVERFARGHDFDLAREIASVIGQEGEQQGWFRALLGKIPSELPFLTTSNLNFAFNAIQDFVVPGTCPDLNEIPLHTFEPLKILDMPGPRSQNISIEFRDPDDEARNPLWVTYINQQNVPVVQPLWVVSKKDKIVEAKVLFPFEEHDLKGLTIASVTKSAGPFGDASQVANHTLAGPGLITVD